MTAYVVLCAATWAVATHGGTAARDLVVVGGVLLIANITSAARRGVPLGVALSVLVLLCWLILDGPVRVGFDLAAVRVAALVVIAFLTVQAVRKTDTRGRETVILGLVLLGCLQAVLAIAEAVPAVSMLQLPRADATLGYANGLGIMLVATLCLTLRQVVGPRQASGWWWAVGLQVVAILATGSRTSIGLGFLLLLAAALLMRRPGIRLLVAILGLAGTAVVWVRFAVEPPEQRLHIWAETLRRIAAAPWIGEGPGPEPFSITAPAARVTTHAHNELLQWTLEYGLIGLALALATVLVLVLRYRAKPRGPVDRWTAVAAGVIVAGSMTDFTLRITALTLIAAASTTLALVPSNQDVAEKPRVPM